MWFYSQSTGVLQHDDEIVSCGYSGKGECKNDPDEQVKHNQGPIPRGKYRMQPPQDTPAHGPFVIGLAPDMSNQMFGRSGFLIHGDSVARPGEASEGCIILDRAARTRLWSSGDHDLEVIG